LTVIFGICPIPRVLRQDNQLNCSLQQLQSTRNYSQNQRCPIKFDNFGVIMMDKTFSKHYGEKYNLLTGAKS